MITQAFILAAGLGTRMGAQTKELPKALLPFRGKALIDYIVENLRDAGVEKIIVNIHAHADKMRAHLAGKDIIFSDESAKLQGTGGAISFAHKQGILDDAPCLTHNCDAFFPQGAQVFSQLDEAWDEKKMSALLLLKKSDESEGDFSFVDSASGAGKIIHGKDNFYTGVQILSPQLFSFPEKEMPAFWQAASDKQKLWGISATTPWLHLGTEAALAQAEKYPRP